MAVLALVGVQSLPGHCQEWPVTVPGDFLVNFQGQGAWQDIGRKFQISAQGIELHTHKEKQKADYKFAISKSELQALYAACKRDYFRQIPRNVAIRDKSSESYTFSWGGQNFELQDDALHVIADSQKPQWDDLNKTFDSFLKEKMEHHPNR